MGLAEYDGIRRCALAYQAVAALAAGEPETILIVPGWLDSSGLRKDARDRLKDAASIRGFPVSSRWAWLRDDGEGTLETALLVRPARSTGQLDSAAIRGSSRTDTRLTGPRR